MLCKVDAILENIVPHHIDDILREGDQLLYRSTARKLELNGQLANNGYLETEQLPTKATLAKTTY